MNHLLTSSCAAVLGATIGIGIHHSLTQNSDTFAKNENAPIIIQAVPSYYQGANDSYGSAVDLPAGFIPPSTPANQANIKKELNELTKQLKGLRGEQSEINREINAITFRLDSHSASFRPLQAENDDSESIPEPLAPASAMNPLLPPR